MNAKLICLLSTSTIFFLVTLLLWRLLPGSKPFDYGLTIDAGSSHSQVILYKWAEKINGTGHAQQIGTSENNSGIDDYGENINKTLAELYPAVASQTNSIPSDAPGPFPIFLGATAGLRVLNLTSPDLVERILNSIRENLTLSSFKGRFLKVKQVRILSGSEEGLFAWVTANYLLKFIPPEDASHKSGTIGILDMGGASAQIAYQTNETTNEAEKVTLFGQTYNVKSQSNLCFGSDQGYLRFHFELIRRQLDSTRSLTNITILDPCNQDSPNQTYQASEFNDNPCLGVKKPVNLPANITFIPGYNKTQCQLIAGDLLDNTKCSDIYKVCPTYQATSPPVGTHFYAISSYYFSTAVLSSLQSSKDVFANEASYLDEVNAWCSLPWSQKVRLSDQRYARFLCFKQFFIFYTLGRVYGFKEDQWSEIHFRNKIGSSSLGWSLGYMLAETNVIPSRPVEPLTWTRTIFFIATGLFILIAVYFVFALYRKRSRLATINYKV